MSQHFLLSTKTRSLSVSRVFEKNEDQGLKVFKKMCCGESKEVTCPVCGVMLEHYLIATRKQWRCKGCKHTFNVTTVTIFAFHKLSIKKHLATITIYTNAAKGVSALRMGLYLDVPYKNRLRLDPQSPRVVDQATLCLALIW
jgi:ribosomal protein L37AE/L43A